MPVVSRPERLRDDLVRLVQRIGFGRNTTAVPSLLEPLSAEPPPRISEPDFLATLARIDAGGPPPGPDNLWRGLLCTYRSAERATGRPRAAFRPVCHTRGSAAWRRTRPP